MDKARSQLGFNFGDADPEPEPEQGPGPDHAAELVQELTADRKQEREPEVSPSDQDQEPEVLPLDQEQEREPEVSPLNQAPEPESEIPSPDQHRESIVRKALEFDEPVASSSISFLPDVPAGEKGSLPHGAGHPVHLEKDAAKFEGTRLNSSGNVYPSARGRKSLRDGALGVDLINIPADEELYAKQYYSMREVSAMFRENQSLIRYWETEFDLLQPKKNKKGDRFFRPVDVRNLELIYDLLRRRKFTIEGARDYLKNNQKADQRFAMIQSLKQIRAFLLELRSGL